MALWVNGQWIYFSWMLISVQLLLAKLMNHLETFTSLGLTCYFHLKFKWLLLLCKMLLVLFMGYLWICAFLFLKMISYFSWVVLKKIHVIVMLLYLVICFWHACSYNWDATPGNGNKDGLYSILLRDYNAYAAATCMNRLAKLR